MSRLNSDVTNYFNYSLEKRDGVFFSSIQENVLAMEGQTIYISQQAIKDNLQPERHWNKHSSPLKLALYDGCNGNDQNEKRQF